METLLSALFPVYGGKILKRIQTSSLGQRLAKGAFWSLTGSVISRGSSLFASIFVARIIGKEDFGALGIIQSTIGMFGVFAGFGIGIASTKYVAEYRDKNPRKAGRIIALSNFVAFITSGTVSALLFLIAPWLATSTLDNPKLIPDLQIGSLLLFFLSLNGAPTGTLAGFEAFKQIAKINLITGIFSFPLIILGTYWFGLVGAVWGLVINAALGWFLNHLAHRNEAKKAGVLIEFDYNQQEWSVLWEFNVPAILGGAMIGPVNWFCNTLIVNQHNGYSEMGVFNAANQWRTAILFVPGTLSSILLPVLSNLKGKNKLENYKKVFWLNLGMVFSISFFSSVPVVLFSPQIMKLYGQSFESGASVLILLCLSAIIAATMNVPGQAIASVGKMWGGLLLNSIWAAALVCLTYFFKEQGSLGLAKANFGAYGLHLFTVSLFTYFILYRSTTIQGKK